MFPSLPAAPSFHARHANVHAASNPFTCASGRWLHRDEQTSLNVVAISPSFGLDLVRYSRSITPMLLDDLV
jgi:hypothetical protein